MPSYTVTVAREADTFTAVVPSVPGAHTYSRSLPGLVRSVREVIVLMADLPDDTTPGLTFTGDDELARELTQLIRRRDDRGDISIFVAVVVFAILAAIGLIADGSTKLRDAEQTTNAAQEAARAAGQALQPAAVEGHDDGVDPAAGVSAARAYLAQAGISGTVSVNGSTITITTEKTWHPQFLVMLGSRPVTGHATVNTIRTP